MKADTRVSDTDDRSTRDAGGIVLPVLFVLLGLWMIWESAGMSALGAVFPRTIAAVMILCSLALIVLQWLYPKARGASAGESTPRRVVLILIMGTWVLLLSVLGFFASSLLAFFALLVVANYDGWSWRRALQYGGAGIAVVGLCYLVFVRLLLVPTPGGLLF